MRKSQCMMQLGDVLVAHLSVAQAVPLAGVGSIVYGNSAGDTPLGACIHGNSAS